MAVVSEGILCQARIAPSYVSASGYYGYVPPCPIVDYESVVNRQQLGRLVEANDQTASIAVSAHNLGWTLSSASFSMPVTIDDRLRQQHNNHHYHQLNNQQQIRFNGSAMETDEDDNSPSEYHGVSRCQNNDCVIPEAAVRPYVNGCESYRVVEQQAVYARGRGNRKRNSAGDPAHLLAAGQPTNHAKRLRQDGGNGNVRNGSWCSGKRGSSTVHYEQAPLNDIEKFGVDRQREIFSDSTSTIVDDCRTVAGNYDDIGRSETEPPCITATNCREEKFGECYLDYEIMLMETHGCSSYHYGERRLLDYDFTEAEF